MNADETNFAALLRTPEPFQYTAHTATATPQQGPSITAGQSQPPLLQVPIQQSQNMDNFQPSQALATVLDNWLQTKLKAYTDALNATKHKEEIYGKITSHLAHETVPQDLNFKYKPWATAPQSIPADLIKDAQAQEQAIIQKAKFDILQVREPLLKRDLQEAKNQLAKFTKEEMLRELVNLSPTLADHPILLQRTVSSFFIMRDTAVSNKTETTSKARADNTTPMVTDPADPITTLTELVSRMKNDMEELRKELRAKNHEGHGERPQTPQRNNQPRNNQPRGRSKTRNETRPENRSRSQSPRRSSPSVHKNPHRGRSTRDGSKPPHYNSRAQQRSASRGGRSPAIPDDGRGHGRANRAHQNSDRRSHRDASRGHYKNYK